MMSIRAFALAAAALSPIAIASSLARSDILAALENRQVSPERFQCHSNCGYTILDAALPDHCANSTWTGLLDGCLDCALEYDIWGSYGDSVSEAAEGCGLDATPEQPDAASSASPSSTTGTVFSNATSTAAGTAVSTSTIVSTTSAVDATTSATGEAQASDTPVPESHAESVQRGGSLVMFVLTIGIIFSFGLC